MIKKTANYFLTAVLSSLFFILPFPSYSLSPLSDTISRSWPSSASNHTIKMRVHKAIPAGGRIEISFPEGDFPLEDGFGPEDVDLSTSSTAGGIYAERQIASTASAVADGVLIESSGSGTTTLDKVNLVLNSTSGISTGTYLTIKLGTNAVYGASGTRQIINAAYVGPYLVQIKTKNTLGRILERGSSIVMMIEPVRMKAHWIKIRSNGKPDGVLGYGTTETQMSLYTNYLANCRYSETPSTTYASMVNEFSYTDDYFHSITLSGLTSGVQYVYYIRCRDQLGEDDATDYIIQFEISGMEGDEGETSGVPGGGGGGSGGGGGGGFGSTEGSGFGEYLPYPPLPGLPGVVLEGYAYPGSEVSILKDGDLLGGALANNKAEFGAFIEDLPQGVFTFSLWAEDAVGRKSNTFSTTFWLDAGTQTTVSDIILSPTAELAGTEFNAGDMIELNGFTAPEETVEIWLYPRELADATEEEAVVVTAKALKDGKYSAYINSAGLANGQYRIKARTLIASVGESDFSRPLTLAIGGAVEETGRCEGADLNGDGRVNLTDFSILLYHWGTDDDCADQNDDGNVDLTDFSIMMYYWTG